MSLDSCVIVGSSRCGDDCIPRPLLRPPPSPPPNNPPPSPAPPLPVPPPPPAEFIHCIHLCWHPTQMKTRESLVAFLSPWARKKTAPRLWHSGHSVSWERDNVGSITRSP